MRTKTFCMTLVLLIYAILILTLITLATGCTTAPPTQNTIFEYEWIDILPDIDTSINDNSFICSCGGTVFLYPPGVWICHDCGFYYRDTAFDFSDAEWG